VSSCHPWQSFAFLHTAANRIAARGSLLDIVKMPLLTPVILVILGPLPQAAHVAGVGFVDDALDGGSAVDFAARPT